MKLKIVYLALLICIVVQINCQTNSKFAVMNSLTSFARKFYRAILDNSKADENVIFSPLMFQMYLTLFATAALGKTREEMLGALCFNNDTFEQAIPFFKNFLKSIPDLTTFYVRMRIASMLYGDEISWKFNRALEPFESWWQDVRPVKLAPINKYITRITESRIRMVLNERQFPYNAYAAFSIPFMFEGRWEDPFDDKISDEMIFYQHGKDEESVSAMHIEGKFLVGFLENYDATVLAIPFQYGTAKMIIILPNKRNGLKNLLYKLTENDAAYNITLPLKLANVKITIPIIDFAYEGNFENVLQSIGIKEAFSKDSDFSGIFEGKRRNKFVVARSVSVFTLRKRETEMSTATLFTLGFPGRRNKRSLKRLNFVVDHPFLFFLNMAEYTVHIGHIYEIPPF